MIQTTSTRLLGAIVLAAAALLTGCARIPLGAPVASVDNIQKAKGLGMAPVAIGEFKPEAGKDAKLDNTLSIRSNAVYSPINESFAQYLKETLRVELAAAGLLDPASATSIRGDLTASQLDAPIGQGTGALAARFVVARAGRTLYDKELKVNSTWESPFIGAVAIPAAVNEYSALHRKLVAMLLADPAFRTAVAR